MNNTLSLLSPHFYSSISRRAAVTLAALVILGTPCPCAFGGSHPRRSKQLYEGPERSSAEVVTIVRAPSGPDRIFVDGRWVKLHARPYYSSEVLPGTYMVSSLVMCAAQGKIGPHYGFCLFYDSFTAGPGETVTYYLAGRVAYSREDSGTLWGPGFSHTVEAKGVAHVVPQYAPPIEPPGSGIHGAARDGSLENVKVLLSQHPDWVSSQDKEGYTPLHWAALTGHDEVVKLLLANKAEVNAKDHNGMTPLHWVAANSYRSFRLVAESLLAGGADVNAKDNGGRTPAALAVLCSAESSGISGGGRREAKAMEELLRQHAGHE